MTNSALNKNRAIKRFHKPAGRNIHLWMWEQQAMSQKAPGVSEGEKKVLREMKCMRVEES